MSLVLGLQTGHESSAALFEDGRVVAAVSDERISRIKNDGGRLSDLAIDEVMRLAGHARRDIDRLALLYTFCLLYTSPSPRDRQKSRMPSSA